MKLLGYEITLRKKANLQSVWGQHAWFGPYFGPVRESYAGAWQQNVIVAPTTTLLSFSAVYRCVTGIANDIAKMRVKLSRNVDGIWEEITANQPWLPVLRKPNNYQTRIEFFESWLLSKLLWGNAYILKERQDKRGIVTAMHVLHPQCVKTLVAPNGDVYYQIKEDYLARTELHESVTDEAQITLPASEIIHDLMAPFWHLKVGVSPLYACALTATTGTNIQNNSTYFFQNRAMPGGVLEVPGAISQETADTLKAAFESGFGGANSGKVLVLSENMKFQPIMMTAEQSQQVEQLRFAVEDVARAFAFPIWKLSGSPPPYTKPDEGQTIYYTDCLQIYISKIEDHLDVGLELPTDIHAEFDLDELLRMDTNSLFESNNKARGWMTTNEQRYRANLTRLPDGGDTVYLQHQDYPIEVIANREDLSSPVPPAPEPVEADEPEDETPEADETRALSVDELEILYGAELEKEFSLSD